MPPNLARNLVLVGQLLAAHSRLDRLPEHDGRRRSPRHHRRRAEALIDSARRARRGDGRVARRGLRRICARSSTRRWRASAKVVSLNPPGVPATDAPHSAVSAWARDVAAAVVQSKPETEPGGRDFTERMDRFLTHPVFGFAVFIAVMGGLFWALFALAAVPMDLIDTTFAGLSALAQQYLPGGRDSRSADRRRDRRHRRHRRLSAADLFPVLSDQPARGHGLPGAGGLRDGSVPPPVRPAGPRVRAAADLARLRAARHHEHAADSGSARSARDDSRGAVHELFGAACRCS